jgi:hypothetical protein
MLIKWINSLWSAGLLGMVLAPLAGADAVDAFYVAVAPAPAAIVQDLQCRTTNPDPCPGGCKIYSIGFEYRCNPGGWLHKCSNVQTLYYDRRRVNKLVCEDEGPYVFCQEWINTDCCTEADPGVPCGANTGFVPCTF